MTAEERLVKAGYDGITILDDYSYDDALIGVTTDDRAVYDYGKMVVWLMEKEGWSEAEAIEWIEYNTIRALGYFGPDGPIILQLLEP